MSDIEVESGSFRDRNGRVYYIDGDIFRGLSSKAREDWDALVSSHFYTEYTSCNKIVHTELLELSGNSDNKEIVALSDHWTTILKHEKIPFISYPYEWPFTMLKDAALLQLELLESALSEDMILKDSTPYNIQWRGTQPVFIDIPSFEKLGKGEPWVGYRQFCQLFLYPLFFQAYKNIPYQPWLRGRIDGIEPVEINNLMSFRDMFRAGVFTNVFLQAKMTERHSDTTREVKSEIKRAGFNKALIEANVSRVKKVTQKLGWDIDKSEWSEYITSHSYTDSDHKRKAEFVEDIAKTRPWKIAWDIGCNTGMFSRIVAKYADTVIAMDADHLAIDRLYRTLKDEGNHNILPLISNVSDPSPNLGWCGTERKSLEQRGAPELALCLALIHHIVISANVPMKDFVSWLFSLDTQLVIEFVTKDDPMVKTLLRNKDDHYEDYEVEYFETCLNKRFEIRKREALVSGTRIMYHAVPKN